MPLKAILETTDGVPADLASHYQQGDDGRFYLQVEQVGTYALEDIGGLRSSLQKERQNFRQAAERLAAFEGLDADAAREALKKVGEMTNWTPEDKVREQIEAQKAQLLKKHQAELAAATGQAEKAMSFLNQHVAKSAALEALAAHGGNAELLMPHLLGQIRAAEVDGQFVAQVVDASGAPRVSMKAGNTGDMTVAELVEAMKAQDHFQPAFSGSGASGSGAAGSGGAGRPGGVVRLSWEEAHDPARYQAAVEAAEQAGSQLQIGEYQAQ